MSYQVGDTSSLHLQGQCSALEAITALDFMPQVQDKNQVTPRSLRSPHYLGKKGVLYSDVAWYGLRKLPSSSWRHGKEGKTQAYSCLRTPVIKLQPQKSWY